MSYPESGLTSIDQLNLAVHAVPPNLRAARSAISELTEQVTLPGAEREQVIDLSQRTAALCGEVALMANLDQGITIEFGRHRDRFGAIYTALGGPAIAQLAPTDTTGKTMAAGKRVPAAL